LPPSMMHRRNLVVPRWDANAAVRKNDFLSRVGDDYGYRDSPAGFIDDWRGEEFPMLIPPLPRDDSQDALTSYVPADMNSKVGDLGDDHDQEGELEREVYLDYAGSALSTRSQLDKIYRDHSHTVLANPHSTGPAASRTLLIVERTKRRILQHLDAMPGRFANLQLPPPLAAEASPMDRHAGYELVFTSGATEGFKTIAERFPWRPPCPACARSRSILMCVANSHTSVVGMRQLALLHGAAYHCCDLTELQRMSVSDLEELEDTIVGRGTKTEFDDGEEENYVGEERNSQLPRPACAECSRTGRTNLLVFPAECNFGGVRPDAASIIAKAQSCGWFTMLDIAKAASTSPVHLRHVNPDFAALSFYKLFGDPTGLGALLVKRSSIDVLLQKKGDATTDPRSNDHHRYYQGGGSVNIILPGMDYTVPKSGGGGLASLSNGTVHFRGIASLSHGFDALERLGGMSAIHRHATSLARELTRRLRGIRHGNGTAGVHIYGPWGSLEEVGGDDESQFDEALTKVGAGPTVALNLVRGDGSVVGYNEVSKLAALHRPPIQFRTGCFCNPGACQQALRLSDRQAIENYEKSGHVCGDHIDVLNGRPTGAIRISFGKDSTWEDMDTFVQFVTGTFVNHSVNAPTSAGAAAKEPSAVPRTLSARTGVSQVQVTEIYLFPIKSCAAQRTVKWPLELPTGKLLYDREFALVDTSGTAIRLQTCPRLGQITPQIDLETRTMTVSAPGCKDLIVKLSDSLYHGGDNVVQVCGSRCGGRLWGDAEVSEWFSTFLGIQCWLARYSSSMPIHPHHGPIMSPPSGSRPGFSNEQPILLISENAVQALNHVLAGQNQRPVGPKRFRPNLVVKSALSAYWGERDGNSLLNQQHQQHIEDDWKTVTCVSNGLSFKVEGGCPRCTMVDYDPSTGQKGRTLRALAKYRRRNGSIVFGIFLRAISWEKDKDCMWIREGDTLDCS
jgi:molybdenum cofactor sulfurtransferase